jgi:hypothetical protein
MMLVEAGRIIGGTIARNADTIDKNPPELIAYDRYGRAVNEVRHCPAGLESRRWLWSLPGGVFNGHERAQSHHPVVLMAMSLMLGKLIC